MLKNEWKNKMNVRMMNKIPGIDGCHCAGKAVIVDTAHQVGHVVLSYLAQGT